ncbi:MAG: hypothetical protein E7464_01000 [Ruminococcaceae bacterium]|nr:hypothetical protein [Oscillospiraceae bacterium]
MNQMIDLCPYLPTERLAMEQANTKPRTSFQTLMMAAEAIVTAVIGVSILVGIAAFLLML